MFALLFAVLGLTPSLAWIPEVPLLAMGALVPLLVLGMTGWRSRRRGGSTGAGAAAGLIAGSIAGILAGLAYVLYGRSPLNVAIGLAAGAVGGAALGAFGAWWSGRRRQL